MEQRKEESFNGTSSHTFDAIIIGAGFSGLYMLHQLRRHGFTTRLFEAADGIGGTWYWNRYPGARCDIESMQYSYSFSEELQQEWKWSETYASQPEILRYLNHVADRFDLRKDIQLQTRIIGASFDENDAQWTIETDRHEQFHGKFCIMATGCLSIPKNPSFKGLERYQGRYYYTSRWPHEGVDFSGQRVAVIGTGSSGIQSIPLIAQQADHVFVFQRTANFCVPSGNQPITPEYERWWKENYVEYRRQSLTTPAGLLIKNSIDHPALETPADKRKEIFEKNWPSSGLLFLTSFNDLLTDRTANEDAAEFVRNKIHEMVKDPKVADALTPKGYPIGARRLCVESNYYETYNRSNVTLINLSNGSIDEINENGIRIKETTYEVDAIVFATGFDAMTGALLQVDIRGRSGRTLRDKWVDGPRTYLGLMIADFPNLFTITGPGSPSVLTNMISSIEQHVDWIVACVEYVRTHHFDTIEASVEAENAWFDYVNEIAKQSLFSSAASWYNGANVEGKPRVFMPFVGGFHIYREKCMDVVSKNYEGFLLKSKA